MKKNLNIFVLLIVLASVRTACSQVESYSVGTNRSKPFCFPGFPDNCPTPKVFRQKDITYTWEQHWVYHALDTNGNSYVSSRQDFSAGGNTTLINTPSSCSVITNTSGTATYTDDETDSGQNTTTTTYSATLILTNDTAMFVDTSDPAAPLWVPDTFRIPGTGDPISHFDPSPNTPSDPATVSTNYPDSSTEIYTIKGKFFEDTNTGDYADIDFTKTTTLGDEYKTTDLLKPYADNANPQWSVGSGGASVEIAEDQSNVSMFGSRVRLGTIGPKGRFKIPYRTTLHVNGFQSDNYMFPGVDISVTNTISGKGDGHSFHYYPAGKGIQIHPPYAKAGDDDCPLYVGGVSGIDFLGFFCMSDDKDRGPKCSSCAACDAPEAGMPVWSVSEPYLNLWVSDKPVEYATSRGERISFEMNYKQHDTRPRTINGRPAFVPVTGWNNNWSSFIHFEGETLFDENGIATNTSYANWTATVYNAGGGETDFKAGQGIDSRSGDRLLSLNGVDGLVNFYGFRLVHSDGSQDIYSLISSNYPTCYTDSVPAMLDAIDLPPVGLTLYGQQLHPCTGCGCPPSDWLVPDVSWSFESFGPVEVAVFSATNTINQTNFLGALAPAPNWGSLVSDSVARECLSLVNSGPSADAVLTDRIDPYGNKIHLSYSTNSSGQFFLQSLTDYDGKVTTFSYDADGHLSQISMPYSRTASFSYGSGTNAYLSGVTDAQGMTSSFSYTNDTGVNDSITGDMTSMITPYGTNTFTFFDADKDSVSKTNNGVTRSVFVVNPDGSHEVYAYFNDATNSAPFGFNSSEVPDVGYLDYGATTNTQGAMYLRNSFYWGRSQCAAAAITNAYASTLNALGANAFKLARMRHWMLEDDGGSVSSANSMEQNPSADGVNPGQRTWFVYPNGGDPWMLGSYYAQEPDTIARVQPDGTTWYQSIVGRDNFGNPGTVTTYYSAPGNPNATTITSYNYQTVSYSRDTGGDPWDARRFAGYTSPDMSLSYSFDSAPRTNGGVIYPNFSSATVTKGDRTTTLSFNAREQVSGGTLPNGLNITNIYGGDGFLSKSIALETLSTNSYTFASGMLATRVDPLGLTNTFVWDYLNRLKTNGFPDGTTVVNTYTNLNLASQKDRLNHSWTAVYDSMGRRTSFTDRNGNITRFGYCLCGALDSITDPQMNTVVYGRDYANRITSATYNNAFNRIFTRDLLGRITDETNNFQQSFHYTYDNIDRLSQATTPQGTAFAVTYDDYNLPVIVQNAAGILVTNIWDDTGRHLSYQFYANGMYRYWNYNNGLLASEYDGVHWTTYTRDKAGQMITVHDANNNDTWFTYGPGGQLLGMTNANNAVTTWGYNVYGQMTNKVDGNSIVVETNGYDAGGRLTKHWTPAKGLTQYGYDNNGNTLAVAYSSGPGITATYDSLNRIATMTDAVGSSAFTYQNFGPFWSALSGEDGPWDADTMSRAYYVNGLPNTYSLSGTWSGSYGYDSMLRLHTLSSPAGTFTYNYANATGRQISSLALPGGSSIAYGYDPAGLLTSTALKNSANTVLDSSGYTYDAVGLRTNVLRADGTHVGYGYDNIGQLTSATGFEANGTPRFNENFGYTYDPAGNLTQRINDTLAQTFTVDPANQLTNVLRTTSVMTVAGGLTNTPTSLAINRTNAIIYADKTFAATNIALVDGLNTFTNVLTISGTSYTNRLTKNLPVSANLSYDLNGNMTGDGLHGYEYDCANQLTRITQTNKFKSEFVYDGFGRRRIRREYAWTGSWVPTSETRYIYDGMLVIQERDGNNAVKVSYTRGLDLKESLTRAGGIGGLLARTDANGSAFYHSDESGNVTALISSSGTVVAKYLYDTFGNVVSKSGPLADANLYRFSSKETHVPSGLYYYGFRYYEPNLQRWVNRDPMKEVGDINLYRFVFNNPVSVVDLYGRQGTIPYDPNDSFNRMWGPWPGEPGSGPSQNTDVPYVDPVDQFVGNILDGIGDNLHDLGTYIMVEVHIPEEALGLGDLANWLRRLASKCKIPTKNLGSLTEGQAQRIQQFATKYNTTVDVVGSRASGTAGEASDFDYVIDGISKTRSAARRELPRGLGGGEISPSGFETGIDVFNGNITPTDTTLPFIRFNP